jgi:hypothetical protein
MPMLNTIQDRRRCAGSCKARRAKTLARTMAIQIDWSPAGRQAGGQSSFSSRSVQLYDSEDVRAARAAVARNELIGQAAAVLFLPVPGCGLGPIRCRVPLARVKSKWPPAMPAHVNWHDDVDISFAKMICAACVHVHSSCLAAAAPFSGAKNTLDNLSGCPVRVLHAFA